MYYYHEDYQDQRQQPSVKFIPPNVIENYINQWIITSIQGYGRVIAYVLDYNRRNGMVSLLIYPEPSYQQQYIQVHHSDLVGISPYTGPTPPRPPRPPQPRPPWSPGHGHGQQPGYPSYPGGHQGGHPGHHQQQGGGFWPWIWEGFNIFGGQQR